MIREALGVGLVLTALGCASAKPQEETNPIGAAISDLVDEVSEVRIEPPEPTVDLAAIDARFDLAKDQYWAALDRYIEDEVVGERMLNEAYVLLEATVTECMKSETCDWTRGMVMLDYMLKDQLTMRSDIIKNGFEEEERTTPPSQVVRVETIEDLLRLADVNDDVKGYIHEWLTVRRDTLIDSDWRFQFFREHIFAEYDKRGLDRNYAFGIALQETNFSNYAVSRAGAAGVWQFMPDTAKHFGMSEAERFDVERATIAHADFMLELHDRYGGDMLLAMAAYNTGPARVDRLVRNARNAGKEGTFWDIRNWLLKETREYVPKIAAGIIIKAQKEKYNVDFPEHDTTTVDVKLEHDLKPSALAICMGAPVRLVSVLVDTPPWEDIKAGETIPIPIAFEQSYYDRCVDDPLVKISQELSKLAWPDMQYHRVRKGDNLFDIARKYGCPNYGVIKKANGMGKSNTIYPGRVLKIPCGR